MRVPGPAFVMLLFSGRRATEAAEPALALWACMMLSHMHLFPSELQTRDSMQNLQAESLMFSLTLSFTCLLVMAEETKQKVF